MGPGSNDVAQGMASQQWGPVLRPYPTIHFWTAQEQPAGMVVTVLRREELHGCVAVMNFLVLPAICSKKIISINELADGVCRDLDRQVAENLPATVSQA